MFLGLRTVIYPVDDIQAATGWYKQLLGFDPYFEEPFYVGFNVGGYELGLLPKQDPEHSGMEVAYWGVPNIEEALAAVIAKGATEMEAVQDVGGGIKVAVVGDPMGNPIGLIENPHFKLPD